MADELGIMVTELPEATNIGDDDLFYLVQESYSKKTKTRSLKNSILGNVLGTASGQPASFPDGSDNPLEVCIADINPKQDLHGYDKPWAGGAGKNKLNVSLSRLKIINIGGTWSNNTYSFRGVTFEVTASDGVTVDSIKANGTASGGQAYMIIADAQMLTMESDDEFILTNDTNGYAESVYNGSSSSASTTGTLTFTFSGFTSGWNMTIGVPNGATATDVIFRPMVRKSSVSDATYEPYANICPISGSTSVTVTVSDGETSTTKTTPLGQTVYGGQLNVVSGELVVEWAKRILDGSETGWQLNITSGNPLRTYGYNRNASSMGEILTTSAIMSDSIPSQAFSGSDEIVGIYVESGYLWIRTPPMRDMTTAEEWKTYLAQNPLEVAYKLSTPQTIQLTPQEVSTILGYNNISADTGDVTVVYVRDLNSCISNIISRIEALEQANSNRSLSLNRSLSKGVEEPQEEVKEEEQEEVNER